jgi:hypothetical protein
MQGDASGCSPRPTASSAAPRGTWTSSTSSAGSPRCRREAPRAVPQRRGTLEYAPPALHVDGGPRSARRSSPSALSLPARHVPTADAEADDPVAEHGPLPRRPGLDRRVGLPGPRRVLGRPHRRLRRGGAPALRARLHLPAARRHQPRLRQRPGPARAHRADRRRPRAPARDLHREHQRARSPAARGHRDHDAHVPRQLPVDVGGRGRLRLRRRGAVRRARRRRLLPRVRRRALGRLRAAALRARRASTSCSAWSRPSAASSRQGRPQAPHRRGARTSTSTSSASRPVRLLLHRRGQRPHDRRARWPSSS